MVVNSMSYATYERYKDSGVDWLGEIPSTWTTRKLKHIVKIYKRIIGHEGIDVLSITQRGIVVKDITSGAGQLAMDYSKYQIVEIGDFAMNHMDLLTGYVDISKFEGVVSPDYRVFKNESKEINDDYLLKIFQIGYNQKIFYKYGQGVSMLGRWRLPAENFNLFSVPIPSTEEQTKIIEFLDQKTAQIDQAIALKQQQIEKLNEYKQIVIQNAVTKGLNPNAPMKKSGVEWIGDIPEHWDVKKLKYVLKSYNKKISSRNSDLRYLGMENIISKTGEINHESAEVEGLANHFKPNHILFGKLRPYLAKVYLADFEGICSTEFLVFEVLEPNNAKFLQILLLSNGFIQNIDSSTYGSKMPRANPDFINNQFIAIPPLDEQLQIINAIENKNQPIKQAIEKYQIQIDRLKEYKNILINQAVTGKIKI
ncbi:hypothetical protein GCM10010099_17510 [Streptomyces cinereus]|nr:hypothetical protein GCM10010099_17510 [Streptomyces cinereus]